jgi:hypothetical protein
VRIHTDATSGEVYRATEGLPVTWHTLEEHGSRTHARSFEIRLEGSGGRNNAGHYGADFNGATWDEWGAVLARIFALDPTARMGGTTAHPVYSDAEDFHYQTADRFRSGELPADTHPRHRWVYQGTWGDHGVAETACGKCSATRPSHAAALERRELVSA